MPAVCAVAMPLYFEMIDDMRYIPVFRYGTGDNAGAWYERRGA